MKKFLAILLAVLVLLAGAAGFIIWRYNSLYIGHRAAVAIALEDSGLTERDVREIDWDFERTPYSAWYEVDIDTHGTEYECSIDAVSGEILHSYSKPDR